MSKSKQGKDPLIPPNIDEWWKMCLECQRKISAIDERTKNLWRMTVPLILSLIGTLIAVLLRL